MFCLKYLIKKFYFLKSQKFIPGIDLKLYVNLALFYTSVRRLGIVRIEVYIHEVQ